MEKTMKKTLLWVLAAGLSFVATPSLALDDQDIVTANLYAECSAIFSYLATEKQGKTPPDVIDSYYAASVAFYKAALAKGGDDMKAAYHTKMEELNSKAQVNELKSAYVMIEDGTLCKVCRRKLKAKNIRVFPNGGVYH